MCYRAYLFYSRVMSAPHPTQNRRKLNFLVKSISTTYLVRWGTGKIYTIWLTDSWLFKIEIIILQTTLNEKYIFTCVDFCWFNCSRMNIIIYEKYLIEKDKKHRNYEKKYKRLHESIYRLPLNVCYVHTSMERKEIHDRCI